jgi:hypothetical protein
MNVSIVTASNDIYFRSLTYLLQSLEGIHRLGHFKIHILDVGLTEEQSGTLSGMGHAVIKPGWDIDVSHLGGVPTWFRAMTARPYLPSYVQGTDLIFWIDADVWIQDQQMLYDWIRAAAQGNPVACLEVDRSYDNIFMRNNSRAMYYNNLRNGFGEEIANNLINLPMINSGVFVISPTSPLWSPWQNALKSAMRKYTSNFIEQTALNVAIFSNRINFHFMPARYNWMACNALPAFDTESGFFVEPKLPHDKIGLLHLASGLWKRNDIEYPTTGGATRKGALRI